MHSSLSHLSRALLLCGALGASSLGLYLVDPPAHAVAQDTLAKKSYDDAERSFKSGDFTEAIRRYNLLRTKYPYSQWATLADLRIADAYFQEEKFATAIEQYRAFVKLHPEHEQVTYARWRVALSFHQQMPKNWFFLPPGYERDLASAKDSERELRYFLRRHKDSEYNQEATQKLLQTRRRLADHELYAAEFYMKRDNPRACALRLTYLLKNYSGLGLDPKSLLLLASAYLRMGDLERARAALTDLVEVHPTSPQAQDAREYMRRYNLKPVVARTP